MNQHTDRRILAKNDPACTAARPRLADLMYEGFYAIFLLKNGCGPHDGKLFGERIERFLADLDRDALTHGVAREDVIAAKYAFCAALDEVVLRSSYQLRQLWETQPLQLKEFGDQLAGEHFFDRLELLRAQGGARLHALEVFHLCLLLGFEGRYAVQGGDQLGNLNTRLGEEIRRLRGSRCGFAPHAARPDEVANTLRADSSLWLLLGAFSIAGLCAYLAFSVVLKRETDASLAGYQDLVRMPPAPAHVLITLP